MASFNITVKTFSSVGFIELSTTTLVRLESLDLEARPPGIIRSSGVIYPGRNAFSGAVRTFSVRNLASDLATYRKLVMTELYRSLSSVSATFPNVPENVPETVEIEDFITDSGVMFDFTCDGTNAHSIDVECKKDVAGAAEDVTIIQRVYKYNADGSLELLAENESGFITTAYAPYSFTPSVAARWGASGDRLLVKYLGVNYGLPI